MKSRLFLALVLALATPSFSRTDRIYTAPAAAVAAGKEFWMDSGDDDLDFQVDVGTITQVKDELRVHYRRRLVGRPLEIVRKQHPKLVIPNNSMEWADDGVVCLEDIPIPFAIRERITSPNGRLLFSDTLDPAKTRRFQERMKLQLGYNPDFADSLACWAVARKCEGKDVVWPPPKTGPQRGPEYGKHFVPSCKLTAP
jgi:hypothetical protein